MLKIVDLDDPVDFEQVVKNHRCVMAAEAAATHSDWLDADPDDYPPRIRELIVEGRAFSALEYLRAKNEMHLDSARPSCRPLIENRARCTDHTCDSRDSLRAINDRRSGIQFTVELHRAADGLVSDRSCAGRPTCRGSVDRSIWQGSALLNVAEWCEQAIQRSRHAPRDGHSSRGRDEYTRKAILMADEELTKLLDQRSRHAPRDGHSSRGAR